MNKKDSPDSRLAKKPVGQSPGPVLRPGTGTASSRPGPGTTPLEQGLPLKKVSRSKKLEKGQQGSGDIYRALIESLQGEVTLEESEERYRRIFELSPDAIAVHSGGKILLANTAAMNLVGAATPEEFIGKPMLDFIHPDYRELVIERTRQQIAEGKVVPVTEEKFIRLDGTVIDVEVTAAPVHYSNALVSLVIFRDISERKMTEASLKESEAKYRNVVELANDGISIIKDGIVKYANPSLAQLAGWSPANIIGSPFTDYIYPDELPKVLDRYNRRMAGEDLPSAYETILVHKNKSKLYVELNAAAIQYEGGIADLVIVRDISGRKLAETALKDSETSYQGLFNRVSEAIYIQDRDGCFLDVNEGAVKMYGYPREYLIGKTPADISAPGRNDLKKIKAMVRKAFKDQPQQFEFWGIRSNGEIFPKDVRLYKGTYFGQEVVIALAQDITQRKRVEDALQRQLKKLTILHAVSLTAAQASSIDQLIEQVTQIIGNAVYVDDFGVALYDQVCQVLRPHPTYHGESFKAMAIIPLSEGIMGFVASTGKPYCAADVRDDPHYLNIVPETLSELCVPIKVGKKLIGVINAESRQLNFFSEDDERLFNTIAGTLATAIEKLHLFDAEHTRRQEAETLRQVAQVVTASLNVNEVVRLMLDQLKQLFAFDMASVFLLGESGQPDLIAGIDYQNEKMTSQAANELLKDSPILKQMVQDLKPIIISDVREHSGWIWVPGAEHVRSFLAVPLIARQRMIGALMADSVTPAFFSEDEVRVAQSLAQQIAIAIENARLYQDALQAAEHRVILHRVSQEMVTTIQEPELTYQSIHRATHQLMPCDSFVIALHNELLNENAIVYALEGNNRFPIQHIPAGEGLTGKVVKSGESIIIDDLWAEKTDVIRIGEPKPVRSLVAVPLRLGQKTTGMISAQSYNTHAFGPEEQALLEMLASYAAVAIENARLYQEAVRAAERRSILHEISQEIVKVGLDLERVYEAVHHAAERLMPAEAFVLSMLDEVHNEIIFAYLYDEGKRWPSSRSPVGRGLSGKIIETGKALVINDLQSTPLPEGIEFGEGEGVRSILAVPLRLGTKTFGMLSVQSYHPYSYTEEDQALLEMLAAHAAIAIENARLYAETLQRLKELEAVNRISTALRAAQTIDDMLPRLLDETLKVLGSDSGVIWLYNQAEGVLKEKVARGWFTTIQEMPVKPGDGIAGTVFKTGQVSVSREFASDPLTRESVRGQLPVGWGGVCVPIRTVRETIGVLFVSVELPRQLQADAVNLLVTLSEMAGNAIRRADLHQQTERQLQRLASLRAVDLAINTILDLRVTLGILIDHIFSQLKVDAVNILLINPKTQTLYHAASSGFRSDAFKNTRLYIGDSLAGQAIRSRATIHIPDLRDSKLLQRGQLLTEEGFVTYFGVPLIAKGQIKGVMETFHRNPTEPDSEWRNFLETLAGQAAIAIDNSVLFEELQQTNLNLSLAYDATIEGWSRALDLRDQVTEGHTIRVTEMTMQLADIMGINTSDLIHIRRGALLHDIGKMGVPDSILHKAGPLTEEEWDIMHRHPEFAIEMLSPITYLRQALDIPYGHHERWDGSGYPRHLSGEQIPMAARIFAVVDVWDALISDRPYRKSNTKEMAVEFVHANSGILFDPGVVEAFLRMIANDQDRPVPRPGTGTTSPRPGTGTTSPRPGTGTASPRPGTGTTSLEPGLPL